MYSIILLLSGAVSFSLFLPVSALFDGSTRINVGTYYGQGPNQVNLQYFCQQSDIDIIPLAFVHIFPAQGNGYPGTNFGNRCGGPVYSGPGYDGVVNHKLDALQSQCPTLNNDIPICQNTYGKKILLSLGGSTTTYQLSGAADGQNFADFLWGAFGPQNATWVAQGLPRPFDGPNGQAVEVDGFDFDVEYPPNDNSVGYIALLSRLRAHFASSQKQYIISGAPQCVVPDANMGTMISAVQFDIIWVQYYNTASCSARAWITSPSSSGFSFDTWASFLVNTASANAKLYIGLPGAPAAANPTFYLTPAESAELIEAYYCRNNFGGVVLWDATYADSNVNQNVAYQVAMKNILVAQSQNSSQPCVGNVISSKTSSTGITPFTSSTKSSRPSSTTSSTPTTLSTLSTSINTTTSSNKTTVSSTTALSSTITINSTTNSAQTTSSTTSTSTPSITMSSTTTNSAPASTPSSTPTLTSTSPSTSISTSTPSSTETLISSSTTSNAPTTSSTTSTSSSTTSTTRSTISAISSATPQTTSSTTSISTSSSTSSTRITSSTISSSTKTSISSSTTSSARTTSSTTSSRTSSASSTPQYRITTDGTCGSGVTCKGSSYGQCCSQYGWCGVGVAWCGQGCQSAYGTCST